jgi:CHASE3 domain sensor protein
MIIEIEPTLSGLHGAAGKPRNTSALSSRNKGQAMNRLGLRMKLALGFGLLLTMLVALGGLTYYSGHIVKAATEEANGDQQKERNTILIDVALMKQIQAANEYVFNGDDASLKRYGEAKQNVEQKLAAIKKMSSAAKAQEIVSRFEASAKQVTDLTEQEIAFRQASRNYEATDMAFSPKEQQAIQQVEEVATELETWEEKQTESSMKAEHSTETKAKLATLGLVLGGLLVGAVAAFLIAGSIARP